MSFPRFGRPNAVISRFPPFRRRDPSSFASAPPITAQHGGRSAEIGLLSPRDDRVRFGRDLGEEGHADPEDGGEADAGDDDGKAELFLAGGENDGAKHG